MIIRLIAIFFTLTLIGLVGTYWFACPCEQIPGGPLRGEQAQATDPDWGFVNDRQTVPLCQIEVAFLLPRSMNVNCMSVDGLLFVSCSQCAGKQWSAQALLDSQGRVSVGDKVYPIVYQRVTLDSDLDRIWTARLNKIGADPAPRPEHWWSFNLATNGSSASASD